MICSCLDSSSAWLGLAWLGLAFACERFWEQEVSRENCKSRASESESREQEEQEEQEVDALVEMAITDNGKELHQL